MVIYENKKNLVPETVKPFVCELEQCPICQSDLTLSHYRSGNKTIQSLLGVSQVYYWPKHCKNQMCPNHTVGLKSAEWLQAAPMHCTYGYDIIASIGWQRQIGLKIFDDIHANLLSKVQISSSQVRHLYNERYLPLLACNERVLFDQLKHASEKFGLIYTLDGLAPEGGEAQLWVVRELHTNLTIRSGWLGGQDQETFENFLKPIAELDLDVTSIMSDKQRGLVPAIKTVFPRTPHAYCQAHYLGNIAEPVANADESMKVSLRKDVRNEVGDLIRSEHHGETQGRVLTVTGILPSPIDDLEDDIPPIRNEQEDIVNALIRRVRYLLTLKGRPPFRLAGIEMFERLTELAWELDEFILHLPDSRLQELQQGICNALRSASSEYADIKYAAGWLQDICDLLEVDEKNPRTAEEVRTELFAYLALIKKQSVGNPVLIDFAQKICKTTDSYASGLFHSYDDPNIPRTNNERESEFRELKRRLLKTTGQKGATLRLIQRSGAWELIQTQGSISEITSAISRIDFDEFCKERQRVKNHRERFRLHTRSADQANKQLEKLRKRWLEIPVGEPLE